MNFTLFKCFAAFFLLHLLISFVNTAPATSAEQTNITTPTNDDKAIAKTEEEKPVEKHPLYVIPEELPVPKIVVNEEPDLATLLADVVDWANNNGLIMRAPRREERTDLVQLLPISLFPSPFPRKLFQHAVDVQKAMQLLRFRVSRDYDFLVNVHAAESIDVSQKYMELLQEVHKEGIRQPLTLHMQRSDYMVNVLNDGKDGEPPNYELKQIEVNVRNIGGAGPAGRVTQLHRRLLANAGFDGLQLDEDLPNNEAGKTFAKGLFLAWQAFGDPRAVILFADYFNSDIPKTTERQVQHELEIISKGKVKIVRLTLPQCAKHLQLGDDFSLRLEDRLVAVVYHRTLAYKRDTQEYWDARRLIERSTAIKVPSVAMIISGSKKVQQVLANPGILEKYFPNPEDAGTVEALRQTFAGQWGLEHDDEATNNIIQDAMEHPDRYVMKGEKQLAGKSHNLFGQDIVETLGKLSHAERAPFILMQRLHPMVFKNYLLSPFDQPKFGDVMSELGVFGCLLGNLHDGRVLDNLDGGHFMRTKRVQANQSGILEGNSVYDSPYLY